MDPGKARNNLMMRKKAALEKGDLTDCTFLVGPDDSEPQKIRACTFDLLVASEYFEGLLRSPLTPAGPIRIKLVEPEIFRLVIEFTHLSGQLVTEVNDLDQCLKLLAAADEFLLDDLGHLCTEKLQNLITLDNVWTVFSQYHLIEYSSVVCEKLLTSKTEECLDKPAFLDITENALEKFLCFELRGIKCEMQLVRACLQYVKGKEDERALFRRCALPHLRLLTLNADDLAELAPFLDKDEKVFLALKLQIGEDDHLMLKNEPLDTTSLCQEQVPRQSVLLAKALQKNLHKRVDLFMDRGYFDFGKKLNRDDYYCIGICSKYLLNIEVHDSIKITGFDIIGQIEEDLFYDSELVNRMNGEQAGSWMGSTKVTVQVMNKDGSSREPLKLKPMKFFGLWAGFETSIFLAKGDKVKVEFILNKPCHVRKVHLGDLEAVGPEVTCSIDHTYPFFKSFYYENVLH